LELTTKPALKLAWIQESLMNLDMNHRVTASYAKRILPSVMNKLTVFMENTVDVPTETQSMARMSLFVLQSLVYPSS
jgi:hypothetical protein